MPLNARGSAGDDAIEFAENLGFDAELGHGFYQLDDWQKFCIRGLLSEDDRGRLCAHVALIVLPRQNGKNVILEVVELYAFYVLDLKLILHTAHLAETSADHMARLWDAIQSDTDLSSITERTIANGKERIFRTDNRAQVKFKTRSKKLGRGGSPQMVVFDEALYLTDQQIDAMLPSLSAQSMRDDRPILLYTSSAPVGESSVLHRVRNSFVAGGMLGGFFAEWSVDINDPRLHEDTALHDLMFEANPGMGVRISPEWVLENEYTTQSREGFQTERLGVVVPETAAVKNVKLPADLWLATVGPDLAAEETVTVIGFDVDVDGSKASIAIGSGSLASPYVEVIDHRAGAGWLPARLLELVVKYSPLVVAVNGAGPAGAQVGPVLAAFAEAGVSADLVHQLGTNEYKQACGGFYTDVVEGRLRRPAGQGPLDVAAGDAAERVLGDAWAFDRRSATVPISPLVACVVARALLPSAPVAVMYAGSVFDLDDFVLED